MNNQKDNKRKNKKHKNNSRINNDNNDNNNNIIEEFNEYFIEPLKVKFLSCTNKNCDHKYHDDDWYDNNKVEIENVEHIQDLIKLSEYYHCIMRIEYNDIDLKILYNMKIPDN